MKKNYKQFNKSYTHITFIKTLNIYCKTNSIN